MDSVGLFTAVLALMLGLVVGVSRKAGMSVQSIMDNAGLFTVVCALLVLVLGIAVGMFGYFLIDTIRDMPLVGAQLGG